MRPRRTISPTAACGRQTCICSSSRATRSTRRPVAKHAFRTTSRQTVIARAILCNLAALSWLDSPDTARRELEKAVTLAEVGASRNMLGFGLAIWRGSVRSAAISTEPETPCEPQLREPRRQRSVHTRHGGRPGDPRPPGPRPARGRRRLGRVVEGALSWVGHCPTGTPLRAQAIDRLRLALGEDAYATAALRGARMSEDELVRHGSARSCTDRSARPRLVPVAYFSIQTLSHKTTTRLVGTTP